MAVGRAQTKTSVRDGTGLVTGGLLMMLAADAAYSLAVQSIQAL